MKMSVDGIMSLKDAIEETGNSIFKIQQYFDEDCINNKKIYDMLQNILVDYEKVEKEYDKVEFKINE